MSATRGDGDGNDSVTSISVQVEDEFLEEFERALKEAQIEGHLPMNISRSEAIRRSMKIVSDDMELIADANEE